VVAFENSFARVWVNALHYYQVCERTVVCKGLHSLCNDEDLIILGLSLYMIASLGVIQEYQRMDSPHQTQHVLQISQLAASQRHNNQRRIQQRKVG
jgi:hypothetical protein